MNGSGQFLDGCAILLRPAERMPEQERVIRGRTPAQSEQHHSAQVAVPRAEAVKHQFSAETLDFPELSTKAWLAIVQKPTFEKRCRPFMWTDEAARTRLESRVRERRDYSCEGRDAQPAALTTPLTSAHSE